jgi:cell division protein FtsB
MAWLKKKNDPISDKARALNEQIAALESQIKKLDTKLQQNSGLKIRSTTLPSGAAAARPAEPLPPPRPVSQEPMFEEINQQPIQSPEPPPAPELFNDFGVRKYDLPALWNRWRNYLRGPDTANPRLVSYLAAGGFQGLRPMRYEKRVARNRFLGLVTVLFIILFLMLCHYYRNHD